MTEPRPCDRIGRDAADRRRRDDAYGQTCRSSHQHAPQCSFIEPAICCTRALPDNGKSGSKWVVRDWGAENRPTSCLELDQKLWAIRRPAPFDAEHVRDSGIILNYFDLVSKQVTTLF